MLVLPGYTATGGRVDAFNVEAPPGPNGDVIVQTKYTVIGTGNADFSTKGTGDGGNVFATYDGRGFNTDGACNTGKNCSGQIVQFAQGRVDIIPEPSGLAILLIGLACLVRRR